MTKKELLAALEGVPDETLIVLSKDGEGNGYSPLADAESAFYLADSTWSGDVYDEDADEEEDRPPAGAVPCVVFSPIN